MIPLLDKVTWVSAWLAGFAAFTAVQFFAWVPSDKWVATAAFLGLMFGASAKMNPAREMERG